MMPIEIRPSFVGSAANRSSRVQYHNLWHHRDNRQVHHNLMYSLVSSQLNQPSRLSPGVGCPLYSSVPQVLF